MSPELKKAHRSGRTVYIFSDGTYASGFYPHAGPPLGIGSRDGLTHKVAEASVALQTPEVEIRVAIENGETVTWQSPTHTPEV